MRLFVLSLLAICAGASPLVVTASGTFSAATPASSFSSPDSNWSLSFDVMSNPVVSSVSPGSGFDVSYSDFSYSVNGIKQSTPVADIRVFSNAISGLFSVCFTVACPGNGVPSYAIVFEGAQAYSGSESAPTILPGSYPVSTGGPVVSGTPYVFGSVSPVSIASTATPEPSTFLILGGGLCCIASARRLMRQRGQS